MESSSEQIALHTAEVVKQPVERKIPLKDSGNGNIACQMKYLEENINH